MGVMPELEPVRPELALAVAEEEYLLAEAEIPEFSPETAAVARPDLAAAEAEIEAISEREREAEAALGCPA